MRQGHTRKTTQKAGQRGRSQRGEGDSWLGDRPGVTEDAALPWVSRRNEGGMAVQEGTVPVKDLQPSALPGTFNVNGFQDTVSSGGKALNGREQVTCEVR